MAAATAFLSINLWTGSPMLALWVGSQAAAERQVSMTAVFVVIVTLAALTAVILLGLVRLDARYRELAGHPLREGRGHPRESPDRPGGDPQFGRVAAFGVAVARHAKSLRRCDPAHHQRLPARGTVDAARDLQSQLCRTTPRATVAAAPCSGVSVILTVTARR